jgi:hypothetical protein
MNKERPMSEFSLDTTVPTGLPVLSRGKHRNPSRGACFMEYTSVLAGESFSDGPRCVDDELAAVLRGANDRLTDAERPVLVPFLGRAIGLAIEAPPARSTWRLPRAERRLRRAQAARYHQQTGRLRRAAARRFMAGIGTSPSSATMAWSGGGEELAWLFWDTMSEPTTMARSEDYVHRLVERLDLLHECYEESMTELGLPRLAPTSQPSCSESVTVIPSGPRT